MLIKVTLRQASLLFLACVGLLILATFTQYGVTWDEEAHRLCGEGVIRWFLSFFEDRRYFTYGNCWFYPSFLDTVAEVLGRFSPLGIFETRHLFNAVIGWTGICYTYRIGKHLDGELTGLLSALFLVLIPEYYSHLFNNPTDSPFAVMILISTYYAFTAYDSFPNPGRKKLSLLVISFALCLAVRLGGVLLVGSFGGLAISWLLQHRGTKKEARQIALFFLNVFVLAIFLLSLVWPTFFGNEGGFLPVKMIKATLQFPWTGTNHFNGHYFPGTALPRSYLPVWLAMRLPEFILLGLGLALFAIGKKSNFKGKWWLTPSHTKLAVLLASSLSPVILAVIFRPVMYDGIRHFIFLMPFLAIISAWGVSSVLSLFKSSEQKVILVLPILGLMLVTTFEMVRLHPYQSLYFNRLVGGGLKEGGAKYEADYWGFSYKEAAEWLLKNYPVPPGSTIRVANCSAPSQTNYYLQGKGFLPANPWTVHDIMIATTRWNCHLAAPGKILHVVEREGVPLSYVILRKTPLAVSANELYSGLHPREIVGDEIR